MPQLRYEKAARPAQVRLKVGDLSNARIKPVVNDLGYARTRETSLGNLRLLHALNQQLHVPPAACRETAEKLLGREDDLPLGRQIRLAASRRWTGSSGPRRRCNRFRHRRRTSEGPCPQGYLSPPLNWFRGLDLDATMTEKTVSAHAEVIMQTPTKK